MFGRTTISRDPVAVQPTVFDIYLLVGWYSAPVSISIGCSNPELLLIPWTAEADLTFSVAAAELTDSLLLGDSEVNISLGVKGFTGGAVELAPSWYIRQPFKTEKGFRWDKKDHLDPVMVARHADAPKKNREALDLPWGEHEEKGRSLSSGWNFIPKLDRGCDSPFMDAVQRPGRSIRQSYSYPATKDLHRYLPWDRFADWPARILTNGYAYPAVKDRLRDQRWNLFNDRFNTSFGLDYSHPATKDIDKPIWCGPNWYPKWCIHQFATAYGELTLNFDPKTHKALQQYFCSEAFSLNPQPLIAPGGQVDTWGTIYDKRTGYPAGNMFGRQPIGRGRHGLFLAGGTGAALNVRTGFLEHPLYIRDLSANYPLVCYDGYRSGPKDSTERVEPIPVELPEARSYYIIMNTVSLKRVADDVAIPILGMDISTDLDSWCWSLSATLRREVDLDLVRPSGGAPVKVEATINGNVWRFVIESYGHDRAYGSRGYSITGRSLSAYLADPYSLPASLLQASQMTAAQLADEALSGSGFSSNWQLTDWLVPAGVYSVSNQTPMQQLLTIAAAAGGTVQSAMSATTISLLPWYASMPWEWGAAAVEATLPSYQTKRTSYEARPQYSGVYVSGQAQGVMCFVKRTGTDGSNQPQMVTDSLITKTEAGLARGKRILADSGPRSIENIAAPLFDDPGLLKPGLLIDVVDGGSTWRGMVIGCQISAKRPTVTQTLNVLRYHGS